MREEEVLASLVPRGRLEWGAMPCPTILKLKGPLTLVTGWPRPGREMELDTSMKGREVPGQ